MYCRFVVMGTQYDPNHPGCYSTENEAFNCETVEEAKALMLKKHPTLSLRTAVIRCNALDIAVRWDGTPI